MICIFNRAYIIGRYDNNPIFTELAEYAADECSDIECYIVQNLILGIDSYNTVKFNRKELAKELGIGVKRLNLFLARFEKDGLLKIYK